MSDAETIPPRTAYSTRGDWLSAVADTIQVDEQTLQTLSSQLATWNDETDDAYDAIQAAFEHHKSQQDVSQRAAVRICVSPKDAVDPRYEYKHGTHLLSTVTESMKQEAAAIATAAGLTVLTQGSDYISLGEGEASVETDTTVACRVLQDVFGISIAQLPAVIEHLPDGGTRHWLASNSSPSRRAGSPLVDREQR